MWILFGALFPIIAGACAIEAIFLERAHGLWFPAIVLTLFSSVHLCWLKTARLILTDDEVRYRALFFRRDVKISEIARAKFEFGPKAFGPMQRIVFDLRDKQGPTTITVNAGLFDHRQSRRWIEVLNRRLAC